MSHSKFSYVPGILLILIGTVLLFNEMNWFHIGWFSLYPVLLLLTGGGLILLAFGNRSGSSLFWGSLIFLFGIVYFLRNYNFIDYFVLQDIWPLFFVILGLSFISIMLINPKDWGVLIPGGLFLFFGTMLLLRKFHFWWAHDLVATYWPLLLVLIGIVIVILSLKKDNSE